MSETTRELTCIGCPLGCSITVTMNGTDVVSVTGNTCPRGDAYARKEVTNPTRIVTSTVRVEGGISPMVNVKTASDIPKSKIFECASALKNVVVQGRLNEVYPEILKVQTSGDFSQKQESATWLWSKPLCAMRERPLAMRRSVIRLLLTTGF